MQKHPMKKLRVQRETVRSLGDGGLRGVAGGISGQRGCHSIQDRCQPDSGGALCASVNANCPSGPGITSCGQECP